MFIDHGFDISPTRIIDLFKNLSKALIAEGFKVKFFTNGNPNDNKTANEIKLALEEEGISVQCRIPTEPKELVNNIAEFQAIIASRLHSCIIAYSLDIPAIGLVWNDKLTFFGKSIGAEQYYIKAEQMTVNYIMAKLNEANKVKYDKVIKDSYRNTIVENINLIHKILINKQI